MQISQLTSLVQPSAEPGAANGSNAEAPAGSTGFQDIMSQMTDHAIDKPDAGASSPAKRWLPKGLLLPVVTADLKAVPIVAEGETSKNAVCAPAASELTQTAGPAQAASGRNPAEKPESAGPQIPSFAQALIADLMRLFEPESQPQSKDTGEEDSEPQIPSDPATSQASPSGEVASPTPPLSGEISPSPIALQSPSFAADAECPGTVGGGVALAVGIAPSPAPKTTSQNEVSPAVSPDPTGAQTIPAGLNPETQTPQMMSSSPGTGSPTDIAGATAPVASSSGFVQEARPQPAFGTTVPSQSEIPVTETGSGYQPEYTKPLSSHTRVSDEMSRLEPAASAPSGDPESAGLVSRLSKAWTEIAGAPMPADTDAQATQVALPNGELTAAEYSPAAGGGLIPEAHSEALPGLAIAPGETAPAAEKSHAWNASAASVPETGVEPETAQPVVTDFQPAGPDLPAPAEASLLETPPATISDSQPPAGEHVLPSTGSSEVQAAESTERNPADPVIPKSEIQEQPVLEGVESPFDSTGQSFVASESKSDATSTPLSSETGMPTRATVHDEAGRPSAASVRADSEAPEPAPAEAQFQRAEEFGQASLPASDESGAAQTAGSPSRTDTPKPAGQMEPREVKTHHNPPPAPEDASSQADISDTAKGRSPAVQGTQAGNADKAAIDQPRSNKSEAAAKGNSAPEAFPDPAVAANLKTVAVPKAAASSPAKPAELVFQLAERIQSQLQSGQGEVRIQLRPEHLGTIEIKAENAAGGIVARIAAESSSVKQYLENNLHILQQSFQDQGLKVDRIDVVLQPGLDAPQTGSHQQNPHHAETGQQGPNADYGRGGSRQLSPRLIEVTVDPMSDLVLGPHSTFHTVA